MTAPGLHARAGPHGSFQHLAVIHDGPDELAGRVATTLTESLATGGAVLVCLDDASAGRVASTLGPAWEKVTHLPADVRYTRPAGAMAMVHGFVQDALARGATEVISLGAIDFDGTDDARWVRYEAAVNDVLSHLPFRGICAYDTRVVPPAAVRAAYATHALVHEGAGVAPSPAFVPAPPTAPRPSSWRALGAPDLHMTGGEPATIRHAMTSRYGRVAAPDQLDDALLAVSELATNGLRHGAAPVVLETWRTDNGDIVLRVSDGGDGIADPYPELRPPGVGTGGYGLWVVGQVCDEMTIERVGGRTVVTARVPAGHAAAAG